jgi:DNA repair exonuclease SbcCD ATPase subunit
MGLFGLGKSNEEKEKDLENSIMKLTGEGKPRSGQIAELRQEVSKQEKLAEKAGKTVVEINGIAQKKGELYDLLRYQFAAVLNLAKNPDSLLQFEVDSTQQQANLPPEKEELLNKAGLTGFALDTLMKAEPEAVELKFSRFAVPWRDYFRISRVAAKHFEEVIKMIEFIRNSGIIKDFADLDSKDAETLAKAYIAYAGDLQTKISKLEKDNFEANGIAEVLFVNIAKLFPEYKNKAEEKNKDVLGKIEKPEQRELELNRIALQYIADRLKDTEALIETARKVAYSLERAERNHYREIDPLLGPEEHNLEVLRFALLDYQSAMRERMTRASALEARQTDEIERFYKSAAEQKEQVSKILSQLGEARKSLNAVLQENNQLKSDQHTLSTELAKEEGLRTTVEDTLLTYKETAKSTIANAERKVIELKNNLAEAESARNEVQEEYDIYQAKAISLEAELRGRVSQSNSQAEAVKEEYSDYRAKAESEKLAHDKYRQNAEKEIAELKLKTGKLEQTLAGARQSFSKEAEQRDSQIINFAKDLDEAEKKLESFRSEYDNYRKSSEAERESLRKQVEFGQGIEQKLRAQVSEANSISNKLKTAYLQKERELDSFRKESAELGKNAALDELKPKIEKLNDDCKMLESECSALKEQLKAYEGKTPEDYRSIEKAIAEKNASLGEIRAEYANLQGQYNNLKIEDDAILRKNREIIKSQKEAMNELSSLIEKSNDTDGGKQNGKRQ